MLTYFEADRSGKQRATINIGKDIIEIVVLGLLFDADADDVASVSRARASLRKSTTPTVNQFLLTISG